MQAARLATNVARIVNVMGEATGVDTPAGAE